jgi:hypothetical protein
MKDTGTPVLFIFIITIGVILYNYVAKHIEVNNNLRDTIQAQQFIIDKKTQENRAMANLVMYMYRAQTGKELPRGWTEILNKPKDSPVH